ncbi:hypothetical protein Tco_0217625 [Tanacetum coccineum]
MMKGRYHKLSPKFYGPYRIIARVGKVAYRLALPANSLIHLVFHVSKLKVHKGDNFSTQQALPKVDKDDVIAILVDEAGNPLKKVEHPDDHDSEDEVASVDNDIAHSLASKRTGFGTQSLH